MYFYAYKFTVVNNDLICVFMLKLCKMFAKFDFLYAFSFIVSVHEINKNVLSKINKFISLEILF